MAKVTVTGYEISCDPGIQNITPYSGSIDVKDIEPDMDVEKVIDNPWWRGSIACKFKKLTFVELRENGAVFHYGDRNIFVEFGKSEKVEEVGLSYAYAELYVGIEQ